MLNRQEAEKRLKTFKIKNWTSLRLAQISELPEKLREVGRALLDRDAAGKPFKNWEKRSAAQDQATQRLEKMSPRERLRIFSVLFPKLASQIESAWQLIGKLPFSTDYDRKAFRAPDAPEVHRTARFEFLSSLVSDLEGYDPDASWCRAWAPYLSGSGSDQLGILLATAIDERGVGDEVFEILRDSATNDHEIGSMGRHVTRALLVASRPEGWEFIEKLLLAAQRQEGLRQVILESIDEAHPEAFRRMLRLILDHNLLRFSATVRAADVWFGLRWDSATPAVIKKSLEKVLMYLEDPDSRVAALARESGEALYFALWALGFEDAVAAVKPAAELLKDANVERRFVALHFLEQLELPAARLAAAACLEDADLRLAVLALNICSNESEGLDLWDRIISLRERLPAKRQEGAALVWPWATTTLDRKEVTAALVDHLEKRPATALIPFLDDLDSIQRGQVVERLAKMKKWNPATRDTLFRLVADRDSWVRQRALLALEKCEVTEEDAQRLEELLKRKGSELRQGALKLLAKQKAPLVLGSADRLLMAKKLEQRLGGLELLRLLVEKKRSVAECRQRAESYRTDHEPGEFELEQLEAILDVKRVVPKLDDALGLMDPTKLSPAIAPRTLSVVMCSSATMNCLKSLDDLIEEHKKTPVRIETYEGEQEELLGNLHGWVFPQPLAHRPAQADASLRLPLFEVWKDWYDKRPKKLQDRDGLELLRAAVWCDIAPADWKGYVKRFGKTFCGFLAMMSQEQTPVKLKHRDLVSSVLRWLLRLNPPAGGPDFLLDAVETGFASVPKELRERVVDLNHWEKRQRDWRNNSPVDPWWNEVSAYRDLVPEAWKEAHAARLWQLLHWRDQPAPGVWRMRPDLEYLIAGCKSGLTTEADLFDQLLGPGHRDFDDLRTLSAHNSEQLSDCPALRPIVERCKSRILEIELSRGETPTAASEPAQVLASMSFTGVSMLMRFLSTLGKKGLAREPDGAGRTEVLTHLVQITYPSAEDTPETFAAAVKQSGISQERLLELAFLTPQWLDHIEDTLDWPGLKEGVWWFLAHMPYGRPGVVWLRAEEIEEDGKGPKTATLDPWERILLERTSLTEDERDEGAVDTGWFHRVYPPLGRKRWEALGVASKYGCGDSGYKKSILLAEVLLGRVKKTELVANIRDRRLKDSVRLLGLLPLPEGERREAELLSRYKVLQEYRRYARGLGPMSREESVRIATVGLENLARTAGYPDPIRLEWAVEAREIADLAAGPVSVTHDGVTVTLAIDDQGQPELTVCRGDRPLKSIPPTVRKNPKVAALTERRTELKRSSSRVKQSLESAMCRGDSFTGMELKQLFGHPLLRPLLERLVVIGEGIRGYPTAGGQALADHSGKLEPVRLDERLRIAHPHDLFTAGDWDKWQADCFRKERVQPFKQVFRELYVVTQQERADDAVSRRYSGQQVNPSQAKALWGSRGWSVRDEVTKTFHDLGLAVEVSFRDHGWTALEVEGLTLDTIRFRRRDDYGALPLDEVPPRVFSEVMRDCDLVVSVAHRGGVDPEASASTVEMRSSLLRETCSLLGINNYKIVSNHVLIDGKLGKYSVHLGSAVVHRQPGGSLCIVPVGAQHRGRLFLPFADDDPRSAEVISKVLLLARDHEIQDPSILEQLR